MTSNTASGTGDRSLSIEEIHSLYDSNTTSSGIVLASNDVLYLDIDLFRRVNTEDFSLIIDVIDRVAALANIDFYYKELESDNYILCNKAQDSSAFYAKDLPELFSPRFLRIIINSVACSLFEVIVTNDDTQVAFGNDGNQALVTMNQQVDSYTVLPIFNNSSLGTPSVNAYILVDYKQNDADFYINLCASSDGSYKGLKDGALVSSDDLSYKYTWSRGNFIGTRVDADNIVVDPKSPLYDIFYSTPVMDLGDPYMSSFVITKMATTSGTSITWDESSEKPIVKIRSSNIAPISFTKVFTTILVGTTLKIYEGDLTTGEFITTEVMTAGTTTTCSVIYNRIKGEQVIVENNSQIHRYKYGELGNAGLIISSTTSAYNAITSNWGVDGDGNVWGYCKTSGYRLRFFNSVSLSGQDIKYDATLTFLTDLAPDLQYPGCWYTDPGTKMLIHVDESGTQITTKSMDDPTYVTALYDGGCLVVDNGTASVVRVDYYGEVVKEIKYNSTLTIKDISYDINEEPSSTMHERFWILATSGHIYQYSFGGEELSLVKYLSASSIHAFLGGCMVHCSSLNKIYQLDSEGTLIRLWNLDGLGTLGSYVSPINMSYAEYLKMYESAAVLPIKTDPVWGAGNDNGWLDIVSDGYQLPFAQFHQLKYKFNPIILDYLLTNGDFETGDTTGWVTTGNVVLQEGHATSYSFSMPSVSATYTVTAYQWIDLDDTPEMNYDILDNNVYYNSSEYYFTLDFWSWAPVVYNTYIQWYVYYEYYTEAGDLIDASRNTIVMPEVGYWTNNCISSKILNGTRKIKVYLYMYKSAHTYSAVPYIDEINAKITLSPSLHTVGVPEPIKLVDIMPQESKNVYLKTNFPVGTQEDNYETQLKCWWGNQED